MTRVTTPDMQISYASNFSGLTGRAWWETDEGDFEIGSIGVQHQSGANTAWIWGIDTVIPMREIECDGQGKDRADCMKRFKAARIFSPS